MWAYLLSKTNVMADPHEYREIMKAAFYWTDKPVEDVVAEFDKKRDTKTSSTSSRKSPSVSGPPKASEIDKLSQLMAQAKPRERPESSNIDS